eukprot:TRINITY_DN1006_c0_g1_i1.p1 TRINITY_DN1006_c0_g1~~TRINITY_DN1006_c0_g1_i1.p1  ORF type:complete len:218 (+),score=69.94 TRINITY_DN1006_c0_g1_i1:135-788(+)
MQRGLVGSEMCIRDRYQRRVHGEYMKCEEILAKILGEPENKVCIDCGKDESACASLNNGVFLCSKCSALHAGLGIEISKVKALNENNWTESELAYFEKGGNKKFSVFLEMYGIDATLGLSRYNCKATAYYRKKLKSLAEGDMFVDEIPPSFAEGQRQIGDEYSPLVKDEPSFEPEPESTGNKVLSFFTSGFNTVVDTAKELGEKEKKKKKKKKSTLR